MTKIILSFENIRASDLPLVGGKGANLGEMTHAGFPIPNGFCVTTLAFQQFMDACPSADELYRLLDSINSHDIEKTREVGRKVRETLLEIPIPQVVADTVVQCWNDLGNDKAYAVRSSATAEDLPDASFAGQQDTYLNIIGESALLDAIRRCWVSFFTDRAILYRSKNNFAHQDVQLSVVIQQMVMSEKSGILFTADPLTGHRHTVAIDASFGLGEALVSGLVSPDAYRVDKRNNTIIERTISDKKIAIYPEKDGGVRQETLSASQRNQTVLTDEKILDLADLGSRVEAHYDTPQDIEWAIVDNQLYLLQARPITSLYPIDSLTSPDDTLHIYFSMGHQQNMTNVMSPLGASFIRCLLPIGRNEGNYESRYVQVNGGRLFADITQFLRHPILKRITMAVLAQFNALAPETLALAMQRPEFKAPHHISFSWNIIKNLAYLIYRVLKALWFENLTGLVHRVDTIIEDSVADSTQQINSAKTGTEQIRVSIRILHSLFKTVLQWIPYFMVGEISKRLIAKIGGKWADEIDLDAISLGLSGNVITDMNLKIGDLADLARQSPQLQAMFADLGDDSHAWLAQARQVDDSDRFMQAWDAFIEEYGARGSSEIDIAVQHWYEDPLPLLQVIASYLQQNAGSHHIQHQKLVDEREEAVAQLKQKSGSGILGWLRLGIVKRLLYVIHEASVLREHHKFLVIRSMRIIKEGLQKSAPELVANKKLMQVDDIWFLTFPELLTLYQDDSLDVTELILTRRIQAEQYQKMTVPMVITSDGESPVVKHTLADAPEGALIGNPVSSGIVEGIVHVIHDPQVETIKAGEILVAPFTDPGWTPLFINASGLIMEVGGAMTHGSVVAREYGIPAIVGVSDATKTLQTGQRIRMDGNRGVIEILSDTPV